MATPRIIPSMAAFAAPYAAEPRLLTSGPVTEETFTMRPYFRCGIAGRTARGIRNALCTPLAIRVHEALDEEWRRPVQLSDGPRGWTPRTRTRWHRLRSG